MFRNGTDFWEAYVKESEEMGTIKPLGINVFRKNLMDKIWHVSNQEKTKVILTLDHLLVKHQMHPEKDRDKTQAADSFFNKDKKIGFVICVDQRCVLLASSLKPSASVVE